MSEALVNRYGAALAKVMQEERDREFEWMSYKFSGLPMPPELTAWHEARQNRQFEQWWADYLEAYGTDDWERFR